MEDAVPGRRAALAFIFVTILIDVLAFGVIIPVLPHLVKEMVGGDDSQAAWYTTAFSTAFALIQFVASPVQGALSDRFGRRPVILVSCLGLGLDFMFMALAPTIGWLFVGRVISAMTSASFTTANAYIADVTKPADRAKAYGLVGAAFGVGFIVGPLIGGVLGHYGLRWPFWFAAMLAVTNASYGMFVLPESLAPSNRSRAFAWKRVIPFAGFGILREHPRIIGLAAVVLIANLAHYVYPSVFVLFADFRYQWGKDQVGYVLAVVGLLSVIVNVVVVGRVVRAVGERNAQMIGLAAGAFGFAIYAAASSGWMFLVGLPISALWAIAGPATQAMITKRVGPDVQGQIQGALSSLIALAGIIGPAMYGGSFAYFISADAPVVLPGIPFAIASAVLIVALVVAQRVGQASATEASVSDARNAPAD
jgi:DHA1 family tetracycline resistance protein-like MFS transporter